ncbi:MAG TPA: 1,4-alpha-glucan branching protein domain-containing protein [Actinomycetales bacterium]|nr:1,4-alpha-glucan branching protein domain-containing protein [Actinomycetales bacterium]
MLDQVGSFALVLHSHLPWLAHHGSWPVGEEWLHQAWSSAYLPLTDLLDRLADEGRRDLVTLGMTPVLAAQLDDPWCLRELTTWLGCWRTRAEELASRREPHLRARARDEFVAAERALDQVTTTWRHGGSAVLRRLADSGAVELLGGPATHPFLPLLDERVAAFAVHVGLDDARLRLGRRPTGIWSPECGWAPGLERTFTSAGVRHLVVDEATLAPTGAATSQPWQVADSDLVVLARDLAVTNRIWSSRTGYPAGDHYRDFHAFDHRSGFRPYRVTGPGVPASDKAPYDPAQAQRAAADDAVRFVSAVRQRLLEVGQRDGRPGVVVAAYDTELFGHWWHEGPQFLAHVLRLLPQAGVRLTTLSGAVATHGVGGRVDLPAGSWGAGKDYRVWDGEQVSDLRDEAFWVQRRLLDVLDAEHRGGRLRERRPDLDQLARQALLALSSDWAFMVTRDQAAGYARERAAAHRQAFHRLAELVERREREAGGEAERQRLVDGPLGALDARLLVEHRRAG